MRRFQNNERLSKRLTRIPQNDLIWEWIEHTKLSQGVSFRKALYSLTMPTHMKALDHVRYLANYFRGDAANISDAILATAFNYRHMNFIADSTSTLLDQSRDEEVGDVCEISNRLINGTLAMPGSRELNPSPLQAIHYMHSTLNANVNGAMNFGRIPWPVVAMHAGAHFPTSECMHIASRRNLNTTWLRLNHANVTERV